MKNNYIISFLITAIFQGMLAFALYSFLMDGTTVGLVLAGIYIIVGYLKKLNILLISKGKFDDILRKQFIGKTSSSIKQFNATMMVAVLLSTGVVTFFTVPIIFLMFNAVYVLAFIKVSQSSKRLISNGTYCKTG